MIVTRSPEAGFKGVGPWAIGAAVGLLGLIAGLVVLGVGQFRRTG